MLADQGAPKEPEIKFEHEWIPKCLDLGVVMRKDLQKGAQYVSWIPVGMYFNRS